MSVCIAVYTQNCATGPYLSYERILEVLTSNNDSLQLAGVFFHFDLMSFVQVQGRWKEKNIILNVPGLYLFMEEDMKFLLYMKIDMT